MTYHLVWVIWFTVSCVTFSWNDNDVKSN